MSWYVRGLIVVLFALLWGCASNPPPPPAMLSYLDVAQKQAYIHNSMSTLKLFHEAALDLRTRGKPLARKELAGEVDHYVEMQVNPIIGDFEANNNLRTRLEVAELQLLCGLVYLELMEYREAMVLLNKMKKRYGDRPEILSAAVNSKYLRYRNIEDGMRILHERLWLEFLGVSPSPSS